MVKMLLDRGASVDIQPLLSDRSSLLHAAISSGNLPVLDILLNAGAGVHISTFDASGQTPLHVAVDKRASPIIGLLLKHKAPTDVEDFSGNTPFRLAVQKRDYQTVLRLFPMSTSDHSTLTASNWRSLLLGYHGCHIEMAAGDIPPIKKVDNFGQGVYRSYPLYASTVELPAGNNDFMGDVCTPRIL
ncbi:ankyrin [Zopfia rhizophila CBS 207.26]|uniref:Ankyrin n=1 Tax=Zopfia rhizophila CBS 207.26 TaxID=1314779 RepID=A0A6A6ETJ9_9PEZI|nr:ankyrin [Zopfia rhizophila CBS 207.26]